MQQVRLNGNPENSTTTNKSLTWGANPVIRHLSAVKETADECESASYGGIIFKTVFFLLLTVLGFASFFFAENMLQTGTPIVLDTYTLYTPQLIIAVATIIISFAVPILSCFKFFAPAIPVAGSIYCIAEGYIIAFISATFVKDFLSVVFLALGITILIVLVMLFLYASRIVKPGKKFRAVITTLMIVSILSTIGVFVLSLIPATRFSTLLLMSNPLVYIGSAVLFIIIAALFLIVDFDTIEKTVENKLPKKYEWMASFGLAFTIIWLYLKVLDLIIRLQSKN